MADLADRPPEDSFVRTAIRGMQTPEHHPDFWDRLAGWLDDLDVEFEREFDAVDPVDELDEFDEFDASVSLEEVEGDSWSEPEVAVRREQVAAERMSAQVHVDAPTARVPAAGAAAFAGSATGAAGTRGATGAAGAGRRVVRQVADPLARLTIEHDAAALPHAMRRASNVVLLAIALVALLVAMFAGLSLVRQRSESGSPAPVQQSAPPAPGDEAVGGLLEDLAA